MFNTTRSIPPPTSLLKRTRYDGEDVYDALNEVFHSKCYLCETKEPQDINVEHFDPHLGDADKKYDWNNLYLSCGRCNNIKLAGHTNLLDCCDSQQDVFRAIKHLPAPTPYAKRVQIIAIAKDIKTEETQKLLEKIYNSEHTVNKKVSGAFLRKKIFDQYNLLLDQVNNFYSATATRLEKEVAISKIKVLTDSSAPYSAFMRWCILEDEKLSVLLEL